MFDESPVESLHERASETTNTSTKEAKPSKSLTDDVGDYHIDKLFVEEKVTNKPVIPEESQASQPQETDSQLSQPQNTDSQTDFYGNGHLPKQIIKRELDINRESVAQLSKLDMDPITKNAIFEKLSDERTYLTQQKYVTQSEAYFEVKNPLGIELDKVKQDNKPESVKRANELLDEAISMQYSSVAKANSNSKGNNDDTGS